MPILTSQEYDISYFDGQKTTYQHNAGYSYYDRWYRIDGEKSLGEFWKDYTNKLKNIYDFQNKKVLEIGCAKGFIVEDLVDMGVDAYGLDISSYAISTAINSAILRRPDLITRFIVGDARIILSNYSTKQFDVIFTCRFLECIDDMDLIQLINEMNRISKKQIHIIDEQPNSDFYNVKTLKTWKNLNFTQGTIFISNENQQKVLIK